MRKPVIMLEVSEQDILAELHAGGYPSHLDDLADTDLNELVRQHFSPELREGLDGATLALVHDTIDPYALAVGRAYGALLVSATTPTGPRLYSPFWQRCGDAATGWVCGLVLADTVHPFLLDDSGATPGTLGPIRLQVSMYRTLERARMLYGAAFPPLARAALTFTDHDV